MKGRNRLVQNILTEIKYVIYTMKLFYWIINVSYISEHQFDGIVFDAGYINFRTEFRNELIDLLKFLSKNLRENKALFILVIPVSIN